MGETYLNPVFNHNFPDPFVLKYGGEYWAYCTGAWDDGRCFGVLRSRDLVRWEAIGSAMDPLPEPHPHYWAPEVVYDNGRFYLYYSVGDEEHMQMRVAVAVHPAGPFRDSGRSLTAEPFAIDGHIFVDDDGARYMFYAADFLDREHIGTGTVVDRLRDPLTLAGQPRPVALPCYDWHIFDPQRAEKGGVCWHTIEGPFVLKYKGRYYQMFSGGNWKNVSYGVSYATSDSITAGDTWAQAADGERVLPILRTLPGQVVGPGHNSVVRGPDNRQLYCVYHRWAQDGSGRVLAIDPLDWAGDRMLVLGPSITPQPAPLLPTFADFFDQQQAAGLGPRWACLGGHWSAGESAARQRSLDPVAEARCTVGAPCFVAEVSMRALESSGAGGAYGISLSGDDGLALRFMLLPRSRHALVGWRGADRWVEERVALPADFAPHVDHLLRVETDAQRAIIALDDVLVRWQGQLSAQATHIALRTERMASAFGGFALTIGWQDLFTSEGADPADLGWRADSADAWYLREGQIWSRPDCEHTRIVKGPLLEAYMLVVNARLIAPQLGGCYGIYPALRPGDPGPLLTIEGDPTGWAVRCQAASSRQAFRLPQEFDPTTYQQFRFRKQGGRLEIAWEGHSLGEIPAPAEATQVGLYAHTAAAAFDLVRVIAITTP